MPPATVPCPQCQTVLTPAPDLPPGGTIPCPHCGTTVTVPAAGRPLPSFNDYVAGPQASAPAAPGPTPEAPGPHDAPLPRTYEVHFNDWWLIARAHFAEVVGPTFGYLVLVIALFVPLVLISEYLADAVQVFLGPPLMAGLFAVSLAQLQGRRWGFGEFFAGFRRYFALLVNQLLTGLLLVPGLVPGALGAVALSLVPQPDPPAVTLFLVLASLSTAVTALLWTRLALFAVPLILDRHYGPVEALAGCWRLTGPRFWTLFGVALLVGLINLLGALLCGVGLFVTIPFTHLLLTAGYLSIAGRQPPLRRAADRADPA